MKGEIFSWDLNTGTLLAIGVQVVLVIVFMVKADGKATQALSMAKKAQKEAEESQASAVANSASLGLFREHVARDYVDKRDLASMEDRITDTINRLEDRLVDRIKKD